MIIVIIIIIIIMIIIIIIIIIRINLLPLFIWNIIQGWLFLIFYIYKIGIGNFGDDKVGRLRRKGK